MSDTKTARQVILPAYLKSQLQDDYVVVGQDASPYTLKIMEVKFDGDDVILGHCLSWKADLFGDEIDWEEGPAETQGDVWQFQSISGKCRYPVSAFPKDLIDKLRQTSEIYAAIDADKNLKKSGSVIPWITPGADGLRFRLIPGTKASWRMSQTDLTDTTLQWNGKGFGAPAEPWSGKFETVKPIPKFIKKNKGSDQDPPASGPKGPRGVGN